MRKLLLIIIIMATLFSLACWSEDVAPRTEAERTLFSQAEKKFNDDMAPLDRYFERFANEKEKKEYARLRKSFLTDIKKALQNPARELRSASLKDADSNFLPKIDFLQKQIKRKNLAKYIENLEPKNQAVLANVRTALGEVAAAEVQVLQIKFTQDLKNILQNNIDNTTQINDIKNIFANNLDATLNKYAQMQKLTAQERADMLAPYAEPRAQRAIQPAALAQQRPFLNTDVKNPLPPRADRPQVYQTGVAEHAPYYDGEPPAQSSNGEENVFNEIIKLVSAAPADAYSQNQTDSVYIAQEKIGQVNTLLAKHLSKMKDGIQENFGLEAAQRYALVYGAVKKEFVDFITTARPTQQFELGYIDKASNFDHATEIYIIDLTRKQIINEIDASSTQLAQTLPQEKNGISKIKENYTAQINNATQDVINMPQTPRSKITIYNEKIGPIIKSFQRESQAIITRFNDGRKQALTSQFEKSFDDEAFKGAAAAREQFGPEAEKEYMSMMRGFKKEYMEISNSSSPQEALAREKILNNKIQLASENFTLAKTKQKFLRESESIFNKASASVNAETLKKIKEDFRFELESAQRTASSEAQGKKLEFFANAAQNISSKYQLILNSQTKGPTKNSVL